MARNLRSLVISYLALWHDLNQKEIGAAAGFGPKRVSQILKREIEDEMYERLLAAMQSRPAEVRIVTSCLEALEALRQFPDLTERELAEVEGAVLGAARLTREGLIETLRLARLVLAEGYPEARALDRDRRRAAELLDRLRDLSEESRIDAVLVAGEFQTWALCEAACEQSVREASRDIESAASWARLTRKIADRVRGPQGWRSRVRGYAAAHEANILRVAGELKAAEALLQEAKHLWHSGSDPNGVLDPGKLLLSEAALRREQRQFDQALALLDQAAALSHPERALVSKGFTLEVMGEHERAIETLLQAVPLIDRHAEPRQWYILRLNLAINLCHTRRYGEAAGLVKEARPLAVELENEIDLIRINWVEGRIAAGLGRASEALRLLEQARRELAARGMFYDASLALLEEAVLLLEERRSAEVRALAPKLAKAFACKGVHREALAALQLFHEAAEHEEATSELARRVLQYLFRARYDQNLRFES